MKICLLTVGKTDIGWVREGLETYVSRLSHYVPFSVKEIPELKNASSLSRQQIKDKEGELILGCLSPSDMVILLDEHGKEYSSTEFARQIESWISGGGKNIVFIIGGAYGFSEAVYSRSNSKLSLSRMTFSHQMVRTIFAEQLYRAFTIIKGQPYHHE
ncbi:MAG: 23S rRNA (pseudouridine(1915)-N(3))-methyltransferase RlmH [Bacteroidales bacterium]|nr:23S rRNA (pseudouridine(1915)-N(3))-methyltransferase RlmH [Bacteroidales bacterium]